MSAIRRVAITLVLLALTPAPPAAAGSFVSARHQGRSYAVFTPDTPREGPLIVALHGCWQTPEDFALGTRLNAAAERRGLVVVYPAQTREANASRCWNWFSLGAAPAGGEVGDVLAVATHEQAQRKLRDHHLIVLGFSAGGFMAVNVACAAPHLVSGLGVASGGAYRCGLGVAGAVACMRGMGGDPAASAAACLRAAGVGALPLRASLWHGDGDAVVSPVNLAALETMLVRALGVGAAQTETIDGAVHAVHRDARNEPALESWLVRGMGHAWSGGDPRGTHTYPAGPSATDRILEFLLGR